jgi:hypothetical protein
LIKILKPISLSCLSVSFAAVSFLQSEINTPVTEAGNSSFHYISPDNFESNTFSLTTELSVLYSNLHLEEYGLSKNAFEYAYKGYQYLLTKKKITNTEYLTICDFSQSSRNKRLYIIDLKNDQLLINTYVAHGRNSGKDYATRFSNRSRSLQSSLGFYVTTNTYYGEHGLALRMEGVDPGFNDKAAKRKIVIHGASYIDNNYLQHRQYMGRSFGCPAVPQRESSTIINTIKNGTCFFIYHPDKNYIKRSKILNG